MRRLRRAALATAFVALGMGVAAAQHMHHPTAPATPGAAAGDRFTGEMDAAMARMHAAMAVPYSGDADRDFARMMIPHHQGAIDMAEAELRFGKDERLRRLAQEIVVTQQQEIALMQRVLDQPPAP